MPIFEKEKTKEEIAATTIDDFNDAAGGKRKGIETRNPGGSGGGGGSGSSSSPSMPNQYLKRDYRKVN